MTRKEEMEKLCAEAKNKGMDIGVEVAVPGQEETELIINKNSSIDNKLSYYMRSYDDDLNLNANQEVKIVGFQMMNFF